MNSVALVGRLTKDPEVRYTSGDKSMAIARFTLAVDRDRAAKEGEQSTDFISTVCFGKTAELVEKYVKKGRQVGITGRIQTGSYEKDGKRIYTTDIVADRVEFLGGRDDSKSTSSDVKTEEVQAQIPEGFAVLTDEDIPF